MGTSDILRKRPLTVWREPCKEPRQDLRINFAGKTKHDGFRLSIVTGITLAAHADLNA